MRRRNLAEPVTLVRSPIFINVASLSVVTGITESSHSNGTTPKH